MAPLTPLLLLLAAHFFKRRLTNDSLLTQASEATSVSAPWNAPTAVWKNSWRLHSWALPLLHRWDSCLAGDQNLNTAVLWWKAIAGSRRFSKSFDNNVAFDLLPSWTRCIVRFPLCYLYPKLHHQNVLIRTKYLDSMVREQLDTCSNNTDILVVSLGAGFDTRSLRFLGDDTLKSSAKSRNNTIDYFELDLPKVVLQKEGMLHRFAARRGGGEESVALPSLLQADLNDLDMVERQLQRVFAIERNTEGRKVKVIFVIEAVLMYLEEKNVSPLLSLCRRQAERYLSSSYIQSGVTSSGGVSLCFADRLPSSIDFSKDDADVEREREECEAILASQGWRLRSFMAKPGRARWMGMAS